jgi:hypothetical protein
LSTTICCFQIWVRRSATTRVTTSGLLPAAAGVMKVTGRVGQSCACAGMSAAIAPVAIATKKRTLNFVRRLCMGVS